VSEYCAKSELHPRNGLNGNRRIVPRVVRHSGFTPLLYRPFSTPKPVRGSNSDLAQYSNTPALHHSARPDSRRRTTTRTRTKRLVRAGRLFTCSLGLTPRLSPVIPARIATRSVAGRAFGIGLSYNPNSVFAFAKQSTANCRSSIV